LDITTHFLKKKGLQKEKVLIFIAPDYGDNDLSLRAFVSEIRNELITSNLEPEEVITSRSDLTFENMSLEIEKSGKITLLYYDDPNYKEEGKKLAYNSLTDLAADLLENASATVAKPGCFGVSI
jgi:RIO-like serine/threonine protein kinase